MIVIGSRALSYHKSVDAPNDLDLVCSYDEAVAYGKKIKAKVFYPINSGKAIVMKAPGLIVEAEITWPDSRAEKLQDFVLGNDDCKYDSLFDWDVPSLNFLYMLKMSHRYLKNSPHFLKTMQDIKVMREWGCIIPKWMLEFYEQRMKDTYTYSHPKLDVDKGSFFDSQMTGVFQKYDHDSIHEAVAIGEAPAYTSFSDGPVKSSKELFFQQPAHVRLRAVAEESFVLALERSLVPFPGKKTPQEAFEMALMKVCTSITSGWFREFAWEHHDVVAEEVRMMGDWYVGAFEQGLANGTVKLKEQK